MSVFELSGIPNKQSRMAIQGEFGVNIFPTYLSNVDGKRIVTIQVVVKENGENKLYPVSAEFALNTNYETKRGFSVEKLNLLGTRTILTKLALFINFTDGTTPVEANLFSKVIDANTWTQPFLFKDVEH